VPRTSAGPSGSEANTKASDVAAAVVDGHLLLPKQPDISQTAR